MLLLLSGGTLHLAWIVPNWKKNYSAQLILSVPPVYVPFIHSQKYRTHTHTRRHKNDLRAAANNPPYEGDKLTL